MPSIVNEYFPNIPEKCLECPGLRAAARNLRNSFDLASTATELSLEADQEIPIRERSDVKRFYPGISEAFTQNAADELEIMTEIGRSLVEQCDEGVVKFVRPKKPKRKQKTYLHCGSAALIAQFLPTVEK